MSPRIPSLAVQREAGEAREAQPSAEGMRAEIDAARRVLREHGFRADGDLAEMVLCALQGKERLQ